MSDNRDEEMKEAMNTGQRKAFKADLSFVNLFVTVLAVISCIYLLTQLFF